MEAENSTKFIKLISYIYDNIDQPFTLEELAELINTSVSSLKRLFIEATNESPGIFIRRLRMEFAFKSLRSKNESILEVALRCGFEDQSAFSRRFKEIYGYSPREGRNKLNIVSELEHVVLDEPDIVELKDMSIQCVTEVGLYFEAAPKAFELLKSKLTNDDLNDDSLNIFIGIGHDNPHEDGIKEDQVRFTAGVALLKRNLEIKNMILPGGLYARFHYHGKPNNLGLAYHYIYGQWSEASAKKIAKNKNAFIVFNNFPTSADEHIIIHVPLCTNV